MGPGPVSIPEPLASCVLRFRPDLWLSNWFPQLEAGSCLLASPKGYAWQGLATPATTTSPKVVSPRLSSHALSLTMVCLNVALLDLPIQPTTEVLGFGLSSSSSSQHLPFRFYDQSRRGSSDPTVQRSVFASVDKVPGEPAPPRATACPPPGGPGLSLCWACASCFSLLGSPASWKHQLSFLEFIKV